MSKKKPKTKPKAVAAPQKQVLQIVRHPFGDKPSIYSNHVVVRTDPSCFQLMFYDAQAPVVEKGDVTKGDGVVAEADAYCVARVTIPHIVMPGLIKALATNYANLDELMSQYAEIADKISGAENG